MKHKKNIDHKSRRNQSHQRTNCSESMQIPTTQPPQFDLNQVHQGHHQEPASENRPECRDQRTDPQTHLVNMAHVGTKKLGVGATISTITTCSDLDGLLESQGYEAGEEERAEGVHVEGDESLGCIGARRTSRVGAEEHGVEVGGWVPSEAYKEGN